MQAWYNTRIRPGRATIRPEYKTGSLIRHAEAEQNGMESAFCVIPQSRVSETARFTHPT